MRIKTLVEELCPPIIWKLWKPRVVTANVVSEINEIRFSGDYSRWEDAIRDSDGYDAQFILDKTLEAILKVKNGEAIFERDSVLLDRTEYPLFLITCLLHIALLREGSLNVLDFGGSLGSSYFQCRKFFTPIKHLHWNVVEQKKHVEYGRKYIEDDILHFYYTIEECLKQEKPDVLILSGVLQFLEQPYKLIKEAISYQFEYVIVDRTELSSTEKERLCLIMVPPSIYTANIPMWFLSEKRLRDAWSNIYDLEAESEEAPLIVNDDVMLQKQFFYTRRR